MGESRMVCARRMRERIWWLVLLSLVWPKNKGRAGLWENPASRGAVWDEGTELTHQSPRSSFTSVDWEGVDLGSGLGSARDTSLDGVFKPDSRGELPSCQSIAVSAELVKEKTFSYP